MIGDSFSGTSEIPNSQPTIENVTPNPQLTNQNRFESGQEGVGYDDGQDDVEKNHYMLVDADYRNDEDLFEDYVNMDGSDNGGRTGESGEQHPANDDEFMQTFFIDMQLNDELHSNCASSDDDKEHEYESFIDFNPEKDMLHSHFQLGMKFSYSDEFKATIRSYAIWKGKYIRFSTNEAKRMRVKCREPCTWEMFAAVQKNSGCKDLILTTWKREHTNCTHAWQNKNITADWLANRYMERIKSNTSLPVKELRQTVDEEYHAEISRSKAYRARAKAIAKIKGSHEEQYSGLGDYCEELKRSHLSTNTKVEFTPSQNGSRPRFQRIYVCLGPLKEGLMRACRPLIGVDGCHVKGLFPGQILTAIGVDADNGWWPIAYAIVEREATESGGGS